MTGAPESFRHMRAPALHTALQDARRHTLALFEALAAAGHDQAARVPRFASLNLPLWELGHVAWFAEWFVLRAATGSAPGDARGASLLEQGDAWFDSGRVAHGTRWALDLPAPAVLKTYCAEVLDKICGRLAQAGMDDAALYPYRLVLAHEDMHGEALLYTLQTLGAPWRPAGEKRSGHQDAPAGEIAFAGGELLRGGDQARGFVFDNEKQAAPCQVAPFAIDAGLVPNAAYAEFMRDGGYRRPEFWSEAGRAWLGAEKRAAPRYWQPAGKDAGWNTVRFGRAVALDPAEPVRHVSLYEAEAYCSWAGRRLPREEEWETAASAYTPGFAWGELWEWTASPFLPYAGFAPDRYAEYSAPYFGSRQTLRGASFATPPRFHSPHFRNFYAPERDDIFAGFRTCAR